MPTTVHNDTLWSLANTKSRVSDRVHRPTATMTRTRTRASDLSIGDILELARDTSGSNLGQLQQIYQWRYDHASTAAKATIGGGVSAGIAIAAATLQQTPGQNSLLLEVGAAGAVLIFAFGLLQYHRVKRLYIEYIRANTLLSEASRFSKAIGAMPRALGSR